MSTVPQTTPARTALVQHYARLDDISGIATLVSGIGYVFMPEGGDRSQLLDYRDPRLTLLGHVHTADQQWQRDHEARAAQEMSTTGVYKGFTHDALHEAFDRLCDPADWKAPISAWVPGELVLVACAAIEFFTATTPTVALNTRTMQYLVTSIGYRQGPAGDH